MTPLEARLLLERMATDLERRTDVAVHRVEIDLLLKQANQLRQVAALIKEQQ